MTKQYTIRNISPQLDAKLRSKAAREKISLNTAILKVLDQGLQSRAKAGKPHHDFDFLFGSWVPDPAFDEAMKDLRAVDMRDWQ